MQTKISRKKKHLLDLPQEIPVYNSGENRESLFYNLRIVSVCVVFWCKVCGRDEIPGFLLRGRTKSLVCLSASLNVYYNSLALRVLSITHYRILINIYGI